MGVQNATGLLGGDTVTEQHVARFVPNSSAFLGLIPLLAAAGAYYPILHNYFFLDDFRHLYNMANGGPTEFILTPFGWHVLLVRNLIFYLLYRTFGLAAEYYFASVLLTHLINVHLLFRLIARLTQSPRLACVGALVWGISPMNEGTLGWYSVYGHALVATVVLWVLNDLIAVMQGTRRLSFLLVLRWYAVLLAGAMSFGVGIGVAMAVGAITYVLLPAAPEHAKARWICASLVIVGPILLVGFHLLAFALYGTDDGGAHAYLFSRVFWWPVPEMFARLLACGASSVVFPYLCASDAGSFVVCDAVAIACGAGIVCMLVWSPGDTRRWVAVLSVIVVAAYGVIAAGRALVTLMLVKSPQAGVMRYHYVAPALIAAILCLLLNELSRLVPLRSSIRGALFTGAVGASVAVHMLFGRVVDHHMKGRSNTVAALEAIDLMAQWAPRGGDVYIANRRFAPSFNWDTTPVTFPGWAALFIIAHPTGVIDGKRVHFVESNPRVLSAARASPRKRLAGLLLAPDELPRGARVL